MIKVTAGIDIGGIDSDIGIVSEDGKLLNKHTVITTDYPHAIDFVRACFQVIKENSVSYELVAIGVAAPNGNHYKGTIDNPVNLSWKGIIPFVEIMQSFISVPVALTNDAKAAAVGEKLFGGAIGMSNFILVTLGTGLGCGIYTHDHLLTGHLGLACEMGHMIIEDSGRPCNTGRKGCLEAYASVTGIRRTVFSMLSNFPDHSSLRKISFDQLTGADITAAARAGDVIALKAFDFTGNILGRELANVASIFDPQAIFLGGGLAKAGELIMTPTRNSFEKNVFPAFQGKVPISESRLLAENGGIIGASALAWDKYKAIKL
jgi:glucokinase